MAFWNIAEAFFVKAGRDLKIKNTLSLLRKGRLTKTFNVFSKQENALLTYDKGRVCKNCPFLT
jgi:hypothetical protein